MTTRPDDAELRDRLTADQFEVTQNKGTERAFTGCYWDFKGDGIYHCVVCEAPLFDSGTKFDSGSGWPSFTQAVEGGRVKTEDDSSHGMVRTEVLCGQCGAHLGHVFPDGPPPTGKRYCINSAALRFTERGAD